MYTRKRKNDERYEPNWGERFIFSVIGLGLMLIAAFSIGSLWWWDQRPAFSDPITGEADHGNGKVNPQPRVPVRPTLAPHVLPRQVQMPSAGSLVLAQTNGSLALHVDGEVRPLGVQGRDAVLAPDGSRRVAYVRDARLYLFHDGTEQAIEVEAAAGGAAEAVMPAWNADGSALLFVMRGAAGDSLHRLSFTPDRAGHALRRLLTVPRLVTPPITNPATGRILIAEPTAPAGTTFATIDPNCANHAACISSRHVFATVAAAINWADYHPSTTHLAVSAGGDGRLYLLSTATGRMEPVPGAERGKQRPTFDTTGQYLAYTGSSGQLYVTPLANLAEQWLWRTDVYSVDWANG